MKMERVLVVLVNWRRHQDTLACLESLRRLVDCSVSVVIVDNHSADGSYQAITRYLDINFALCGASSSTKMPAYACGSGSVRTVYLFENDINSGFAGGNNTGVRLTLQQETFDYFWFLNNDTEVDPLCLRHMLDRISGSIAAGICGSTLIYEHDRTTVQCFGGYSVSVWLGLTYGIGHGNHWPCAVDRSAVESRLHYISGASMLVSEEFVGKVGLMTEDYFVFYEEFDWAMRAKKAGYSLVYADRAIVYHKEGASIGSGIAARRSAFAEYYGLRNKLLFTRRFFPLALPSVWLLAWGQVLLRLVNGNLGHARLMARVLLGLGSAPQPK